MPKTLMSILLFMNVSIHSAATLIAQQTPNKAATELMTKLATVQKAYAGLPHRCAIRSCLQAQCIEVTVVENSPNEYGGHTWLGEAMFRIPLNARIDKTITHVFANVSSSFEQHGALKAAQNQRIFLFNTAYNVIAALGYDAAIDYKDAGG